MIKDQPHYHATFLFNKTPHEVYHAINDIGGWWSTDLEGSSQQPGDEFAVHFVDIHSSTQKLIEVIPDKKVVWLVTDSNLSFLKNRSEWTGTRISFEIDREGDRTRLQFVHYGLLPEIECFKDCSMGWNQYLQSLVDLINTGAGRPNLKEVQTV